MYFVQYFLFWKSMFCKLFFNNSLLIWSVILLLIICLRISILKISHYDLHVWSVMSLERTCSQCCPTYYLSIESKSAYKLSKYNCKSLTATGMWNPGNVEESSGGVAQANVDFGSSLLDGRLRSVCLWLYAFRRPGKL